MLSEDISIHKHEQFQEGVVAGLLGRYGLAHRKWDMMTQSNYSRDKKYLSIDTFNMCFPLFPIWLWVGNVIVQPNWVTPLKLFGQFGKLPISQEFLEIRDSIEINKPVGMLFKWERSEEFIMHSLRMPAARDVVQVRIQLPRRGTIVVEPFCGFLKALDKAHKPHSWMPSTEGAMP